MKLKDYYRKGIQACDRFLRPVVLFLDSNKFLYVIIALFILQALWIAFSFRYPMIYDEARHVPIVAFFANHISPFVDTQPRSYDSLGSLDITTGFTASLYHYLMSFPYRVVSVITNNEVAKIISLRVLNILLVAIGLVIYAKVFDEVRNIKKRYVHIGLLIFVLLPIVPFVAAHVNYDNLLFLMTGIFFLLAVRMLRERKIHWSRHVGLLVVGCVTTLVKFTFLPVFAASTLFLLVAIRVREGSFRAIAQQLTDSFKQTQRRTAIIGLSLAVLIIGLFSFMYTRNVLVYGAPRPKCEQILSVERCGANPVAKRNIDAKATAPSRPLMPISHYSYVWYTNMVNFTVMTGATLPSGRVILNEQIPILNQIIFFGTILAALVTVYSWRGRRFNSAMWFLIVNMVALMVVVFINNYLIYRNFHLVFATQPRYLLTVIPIALIVAVSASAYVFRRFSATAKFAGLVTMLLLLTQGGGVITHIVKSDTSWYWNNSVVTSANTHAKKILAPLVKEN